MVRQLTLCYNGTRRRCMREGGDTWKHGQITAGFQGLAGGETPRLHWAFRLASRHWRCHLSWLPASAGFEALEVPPNHRHCSKNNWATRGNTVVRLSWLPAWAGFEALEVPPNHRCCSRNRRPMRRHALALSSSPLPLEGRKGGHHGRNIHTQTHTHTHIYIYMFIYTCIHTHAHTHVHKEGRNEGRKEGRKERRKEGLGSKVI